VFFSDDINSLISDQLSNGYLISKQRMKQKLFVFLSDPWLFGEAVTREANCLSSKKIGELELRTCQRLVQLLFRLLLPQN
jgi:hypothetical protein